MGWSAGELSAWLAALSLAALPARAAEPDPPRPRPAPTSPQKPEPKESRDDLELLRDLELIQDLELLRSWDPKEDLPIPAAEKHP